MSNEYSFRDGIRDVLHGNFSNGTESARRYTICNACPDFQRVPLTCKLCGCFMPAKTKLENAKCPAGK
jgi:hypothetical protein